MPKKKKKSGHLSKSKAREMLLNPPGGKKLTKKQRGLFGAVAAGKSKKGKSKY